ncbi:MAG: response regulator, partial [Candidatus Marinimicrobia bacterium]|nr:response regulator [Candidatus Neomarinimicrobiota bacterium]
MVKARIPSKTGKILVVEDDPASRLLLETLLNGAGHEQIYLAGDGRQALEICESEDIDLILLDL